MTEHGRGIFISFEGGDGVGKSTQIRLLAEQLKSAGLTVVLTREPGGSAGAEEIRKLLVEGDKDRWSPMTEALLMVAARRDHLEKVILPALARGEAVITDRFADSTMAYQGIAGALGRDAATSLHQLVVDGNDPDLSIILDLPIEEGLARASGRDNAETRFESKGQYFHQKVRNAFLEIAKNHPERCVVIDASGEPETIAAAVWDAVKRRLGDHFDGAGD